MNVSQIAVEEILNQLAQVPLWAAWLGIGVASATVAGDYWRVWWHRYKVARYNRRLTYDPYMLREEAREYALMIGEPPGEVELSKTLLAAVQLGLVAWAAAALFALGLAWLWEIGSLIFGLLMILYALWRRLNDPPEARNLHTREVTIPREAVLGLFGGIGMAAAVVGLVTLL